MPKPPRGLAPGPDGALRCAWCLSAPEYLAYHDREWGFPSAEEVRLFEKLCLEGFQAGLSWLTILRKREGFRHAFDGFDPERVARYGPDDVARLLADPGIVRNRAKVAAAITNAGAVLALRDAVAGGLDALVWSFAPDPAARPVPRSLGDVPATSPESVALAKRLRRHGFVFVGPTTAYAAMQACGVVDDHLEGCHARGAERVIA